MSKREHYVNSVTELYDQSYLSKQGLVVIVRTQMNIVEEEIRSELGPDGVVVFLKERLDTSDGPEPVITQLSRIDLINLVINEKKKELQVYERHLRWVEGGCKPRS